MRNRETEEGLLLELARSYGVLPAYRGAGGDVVQASRSSLLAVLRCLGAVLPDRTPGEDLGLSQAALAQALEERHLEAWRRLVDPVVVAWDGVLPPLTVRSPSGDDGTVGLTLVLEEGTAVEWGLRLGEAAPAGGASLGRRRLEARRFTAAAVRPPLRVLPPGYHRLIVEVAGRTDEARVISAPRRCWGGSVSDSVDACGAWGLFAPLYALRSGRDWGAGDLADLATLCHRTAAEGGSVVSTLPLLPGQFEEPFDPSPYRPASRLFWNEAYLAVDHIPEWEECASARALVSSGDLRARMLELRALDLVDHRGVMAVKRQVLEELVAFFASRGRSERRAAFASWLGDHPEAPAYARYRAERESSGPFGEHYHLYVQWQMDEQLTHLPRLAERPSPGPPPTGDRDGAGGAPSAGLFLDLPVGVHPHGFDVARRPHLFAQDASVGAPPDAFFSLGQRWDSPPFDPHASRREGHRYLAACLRHHMRHAAYLRVDHVMWLHRLFWIPEGVPAAEGAYVEYPAEELYALLSLESHRSRTVVVGEDLGTVAPGVRSALRRHGVARTWVAQASFRFRAADPVGAVPRGSVAAINTHDMAPFAGFLAGEDIRVRLETGQVDRDGARREAAARTRLVARLHDWAARRRPAAAEERSASTPAVATSQGVAGCGLPDLSYVEASLHQRDELHLLGALFDHLRQSDARLTMLSLEDLALETRPQNVPGTGLERSNWRRKVRG